MTQTKNLFRNLSKEFIHAGLKVCSQNESKLNESSEWFPEIKEGEYKKTVRRSIINYDYFIERLISEQIEDLESFQLLNSVLSEKEIKNYYKNSAKLRNEKVPSDVEDLTKDIPKKFLVTYVKLSNNFIFNENIFSSAFSKFNHFLENYSQNEHIAPLYNFKYSGKLRKISFDNITLRPITENELKIISGLDGPKIANYIDAALTHVIEINLESENFLEGITKAQSEFQMFFDALTLSFRGDLEMGRIYQNLNNDWKTFEKSEKVSIYSIKNKLIFPEKSSQSFRIFYKTFKNSNLEEKENLFLKMAIDRFRIGLNRTILVDSIVDFFTSLESLYASGPGDLTRKLSQRGSMVLSKNEETREEIYDFLKKGYNIRSGLVHGDSTRDLPSKISSLEEFCNILEELTRESIKIYLKLIIPYSGKEKNKKIINDIDLSLINRQKFTILKRKY